MVSPESAGSTVVANALLQQAFRGHGLISRLQGKMRNRRDPMGTTRRWAERAERQSEVRSVKVNWESDQFIVVMKRGRLPLAVDMVERRD